MMNKVEKAISTKMGYELIIDIINKEKIELSSKEDNRINLLVEFEYDWLNQEFVKGKDREYHILVESKGLGMIEPNSYQAEIAKLKYLILTDKEVQDALFEICKGL